MTERPREPDTAWASEPRAAEPKMQLAENLESAGARTFVYVDDAGRVQPTWRYRLLTVVSWLVLAVLWAECAALLALFAGVAGVVIALVLGAVFLHVFLLSRWSHRGVVLLAHDQLDAADRLLSLAERWSPLHLGVRALALQNRSAVAQRRGEHARALALAERALELRSRVPFWLQRGLHYWLLRYAEIILLCNVGQIDEAAQRLGAIDRAPTGEYLLLRAWTAELYLALCRGRLDLDEGELARRTARAEAIPTSPELAALAAWAWQARGEHARAARLLRIAKERADIAPFEESLPHLASWMSVDGDAHPPSDR